MTRYRITVDGCTTDGRYLVIEDYGRLRQEVAALLAQYDLSGVSVAIEVEPAISPVLVQSAADAEVVAPRASRKRARR